MTDRTIAGGCCGGAARDTLAVAGMLRLAS